MQQDVVSIPARRFQAILRKGPPGGASSGIVKEILEWDGRLTADSRPALVYEVWMSRLPAAVFGEALGARVDSAMVLRSLESEPNPKALADSLARAMAEIETNLGSNRAEWKWGRLHRLHLRHPLGAAAFHRGPIARPGDGRLGQIRDDQRARRIRRPVEQALRRPHHRLGFWPVPPDAVYPESRRGGCGGANRAPAAPIILKSIAGLI
jgi:hypothetical protein